MIVLTKTNKLLIGIACILTTSSLSFAQITLDLIGEINFSGSPCVSLGVQFNGGSDVWGYTAPDSSEYAIMGIAEGIAFVKVPEMQVIDIIPGPTEGDCIVGRDIKTYGHYAYAVSDLTGENQGLMIMDLQYLPDSVHFVKSFFTQNNITSHNMTIDQSTGYAYLVNQLVNETITGFRVINLANPENPSEITNVPAPAHDLYARNDTVYAALPFNGYSIWNLSDKNNPIEIAQFRDLTESGINHNIWPSDDGNYVITTEEEGNKSVQYWNIQDLNNIGIASSYLGKNGLAHNAHIKGDLAFISHYSYGVVVLDLKDPGNIREVGHYDTYPENDDGGFIGCWGVYPYSPNNYIYASNTDGKLTILKLEGQPLEPLAIQKESVIEEYHLSQNYPNPFNHTTTIEYSLAHNGDVNLAIYDALGRMVLTLVNTYKVFGEYTIVWDGKDNSGNSVPAGNYYYKLAISGDQNYQITKKIVFVK